MVQPLELSGAADAGVGRLAGVCAEVNHEAVLLPEGRAAVRALMGLRIARVHGSLMSSQISGSAVERVTNVALHLALLTLLVLCLPVEQHKPSKQTQLRTQKSALFWFSDQNQDLKSLF